MSDHEADDPALAGFITLQKERLQSLTRLQQNYKKDAAAKVAVAVRCSSVG